MECLTTASTPESSAAADHTLSRPPSAVAVFSNLVSGLYAEQIAEQGPLTSRAARTTSELKLSLTDTAYTLPTEILICIFQFAFETCVDWNKTSTLHPKHTTVWLEDDPLSPSLFPYSLASVCVRWFHILSSIAVYWTRQVISVGSHATSPFAIRIALQSVGNLSLQLIVTRDLGVTIEANRNEHALAHAMFGLLRPHIHHTWSLVFDMRHSSSLPTLYREQADARYLRMLTSMSSRSGIGSTTVLPQLFEPHSTSDSYECNTSLSGRLLDEIMPGGHFFGDTLVFGEQRNLWFCNITFLTIRGHATPNQCRISLYKFLTTIQNCGLLKKLIVEDVSFVNDVPSSHRFRLEIPNVSLRKIADGDALGCIVSQALGIRLKESVTLSNCPFGGFGKRSSFRPRISSTHLALEGMSASTTAIQQLVCFWNGENLSLTDCLGVSSTFLKGLPTQEMPPDLRRLRITDCENVSTEGLMALVRSREIQSVIDVLFPGDAACMALIELHVCGRGSPISSEHAAWFSEHVESFSWDTTTSDGTRYTWDTYTRELIVVFCTHHDEVP